MRTCFCILAVWLPLVSFAADPVNTTNGGLKKALKELDDALEHQAEYDQMKQSHIAQQKQRYGATASGKDYYIYLDNLYEEYFRFDVDSTFYYAHKKMDLARELGEDALIHDAALDLSSRFLTSGMYYSAKEVMEQLRDYPGMTHEEKARGYQTFHSLYHFLALSNKDMVLQPYYLERERYYQQLSGDNYTPDQSTYYSIMTNVLLGQGKTREARELMESFAKNYSQDTNDDMAMIHYWIAKCYDAEGNTDLALEHFATSARYDIISSYKSSRSLVRAARLALKKGQINRAYKYITHASQEAYKIDARTCLNEAAQVMPDIVVAYEKLEKKRYSEVLTSLVITLFLLVISIGALVLTHHFRQRLSRANRHIGDMNKSLQQSVVKLKEANDIKDSYLGHYLSMFSNHIGSLERYRSSLRSVAKTLDLKEIQQALKSDEFIDAERDILYQEFDRAFLGIFPDFVPQLNALLQEDKRIGLNLPEGKLSNELRIFALIRMGVSESAQIAQFLKKSPSTIYNYRVKLRNASLCPKEEFEERLMEIGKAL